MLPGTKVARAAAPSMDGPAGFAVASRPNFYRLALPMSSQGVCGFATVTLPNRYRKS